MYRKTNKHHNLSKELCKKRQNEKGQGLVEYLILVALIAVGSLAVVRVVGANIAKQYENINIALGADTDRSKTRLLSSPQNALEKKDLGNFLNGAASGDEKKH